MYIDWTKNIQDPEEKTRFESQVISAKPVLDRLLQLCQDKGNQIEQNELDFDKTNWAIRQASFIGSRAALAWMKKLIDLDQQRINTIG